MKRLYKFFLYGLNIRHYLMLFHLGRIIIKRSKHSETPYSSEKISSEMHQGPLFLNFNLKIFLAKSE